MRMDREAVEAALRGRYRVERELGQGGMATVYLAEDVKHRRRVAVKVLRPELSAAVGRSRFLREINIVAQLSHPNILPLHDSGEGNGLLYYVMPHVDGGSLRERLNDGGQLPVGEALHIMHAVADALSHAHSRNLVHRDIKPENILFLADHPVVSDFGIARAMSAVVDTNLTDAGLAVGTPAYISPEQAVGDSTVDHRADLYSFGVLAYELLAGDPPFARRTPQQTIAAHVTEVPRHIDEQRPGVPPQVAELIMRCLEKDPALRPQSAADVMRVLETVSGLELASSVRTDARVSASRMLARAVVIYAMAFVAVAAVSWGAMMGLGLPDWVFPGALIVMAAGLPAIFLTSWVHYRAHRTPTSSTGSTSPGLQRRMALRLTPFATWRLTAIGTTAAIVVFALGVSGFMGLRAAGIGPAATLLTSGTLQENERVIIADFDIRGVDSTLGPLLTTMARAALEQSGTVFVMSETAVAGALRRMRRAPSQAVDLELAQEVAAREGLKAIIHGEIASLGGAFLVTLRLLESESGRTLVSLNETTEEVRELVTVVDRLSRRMRSRIGEPLKQVRSTPPLERVTTPSLDALQRYTAAYRAHYSERDAEKAVQLLQEAVTFDTGFAMAWRLLALSAGSIGLGPQIRDSALTAAFRHRDRATAVERDLITAMYYHAIGRDRARAARAYEGIVERDPDNIVALHSLAVIYGMRRELPRAESLFRNITARDSSHVIALGNLVLNLFHQGKVLEAARVIAEGMRRFPDDPVFEMRSADLHWFRGDLEAYERSLDSLRASDKPRVRRWGSTQKSAVARLRGRLVESGQLRDEARSGGGPGSMSEMFDSIQDAATSIEFRRKPEEGIQLLDATVGSIWAGNAPTMPIGHIGGYAAAGRPDRARALLQRYVNLLDTTALRLNEPAIQDALGWITLGEGRYMESAAHFRRAAMLPDGPATECGSCLPGSLAAAYDAAGQSDSAIVWYERFIRSGELEFTHFHTIMFRARALERLGQLYDAKGDREQAAHYHSRFVELWDRADPELQPRVSAARARLAVLTGREAGGR
jgi:eukaryotic-like serine/threonine-protein kinase